MMVIRVLGIQRPAGQTHPENVEPKKPRLSEAWCLMKRPYMLPVTTFHHQPTAPSLSLPPILGLYKG